MFHKNVVICTPFLGILHKNLPFPIRHAMAIYLKSVNIRIPTSSDRRSIQYKSEGQSANIERT